MGVVRSFEDAAFKRFEQVVDGRTFATGVGLGEQLVHLVYEDEDVAIGVFVERRACPDPLLAE